MEWVVQFRIGSSVLIVDILKVVQFAKLVVQFSLKVIQFALIFYTLYSPEITSISGEIALKSKFRIKNHQYVKIIAPSPILIKIPTIILTFPLTIVRIDIARLIIFRGK